MEKTISNNLFFKLLHKIGTLASLPSTWLFFYEPSKPIKNDDGN